MRAPGRLNHCLVFRCVFVGFKENLIQLIANRLRAFIGCKLCGPIADLRGYMLFLFNSGQCLLYHFCAGLFESTFARTPEVVRSVKQTHQTTCLLNGACMAAKILAC